MSHGALAIALGFSVRVTVATDSGLRHADYLISRNRTRLGEGVLNRRHRLARLLIGRSAGDVVCPGGAAGIHWLRIRAVAPPGPPLLELPDPNVDGDDGEEPPFPKFADDDEVPF